MNRTARPQALIGARFRGLYLATALTLTLSAACPAAGLSLNVDPGLWQLETSGSASGTPQIPTEMLAKLPPDQRAIATMMLLAIITQASMPHSMQFCLTAEQLRQGLDLDRVVGKHCHRTTQSSSPMGLDMQVDCTANEGMSGDVHLRVMDRATVTGNVDVHAGIGSDSLTVRQTLRGRWLGADCGDVQPYR